MRKEKKQFRIVVFGLKGGSGKSTLVNILADILTIFKGQEVSIVEVDPQETLLNSYKTGFSNRHKPVIEPRANKPIVIYDTAGYKDSNIERILRKADIILMPVQLSQKDVLALTQALSIGSDGLITSSLMRKKTWVIFNRIRKPYNSLYKKYKPMFIDYINSVGDINITKTELSALNAFEDITGSDETTLNETKGKRALKEALSLLNELPIKIDKQK